MSGFRALWHQRLNAWHLRYSIAIAMVPLIKHYNQCDCQQSILIAKMLCREILFVATSQHW
jgi:hypothetical protein